MTLIVFIMAMIQLQTSHGWTQKEWEIHSEIVSEIGCPCGMVSMWFGPIGSVPEGYVLCDGTNHDGFNVPDLRGRFIVGAGSGYYDNGAMGGVQLTTLTVDNLPAHTHGILLNTADDPDGTHGHGHVLAADNDANSIHSHELSGDRITIGDAGNHDHDIGTAVTIGGESGHTHPINERDTGGDAAHEHVMQAFLDDSINTATQVAGVKAEPILDGDLAIKDVAGSIHVTETDGDHVHTVPQTDTQGGTSHTHTISGTVVSEPNHDHPISGDTGTNAQNNDGGHSHIVSGSINGGAHIHSIAGTSGSAGMDEPFDNRPPYFALYYVCCIGRNFDR